MNVDNQTDLTTLPPDALIRADDVLRMIPVSLASLMNGSKKGIYPKPRKIGPRLNAWRLGDVLDWCNATTGGQS
jgi:predicted DNA-binding transcriptional regulator AlpA